MIPRELFDLDNMEKNPNLGPVLPPPNPDLKIAPPYGAPQLMVALDEHLKLYQRELDRMQGEIEFLRGEIQYWRKSQDYWMNEALKVKMLAYRQNRDFDFEPAVAPYGATFR